MVMTETEFEPKIVGFLCNWCSYAGADLCGVSRYQYPTNVRVIRVMCSARVDPSIVLEMFLQGADGVFVGGCHIGDCHYITGNLLAKRRMATLNDLLEAAGMDPRRLRLEWVSASEGQRFSQVMTDFIGQIKELGPSPVSGKDPDMALLEALYIAENVASDFRVRTLTTKGFNVVDNKNVYGNSLSDDHYDKIVRNAIKDEFARLRIMYTIKYEPKTVSQISALIDIPSKEVLEHIVTLKDRGLITMKKMEGNVPYYQSHSVIEISEYSKAPSTTPKEKKGVEQ